MLATCLIFGLQCKRGDSPSTSAPTPERVIVYCSVDENFARPILIQFRQRSGIELQVTFDSEAGKTTGLVKKIVEESSTGRPRADLFWSGEVFNTILLARQGLLDPYDSPAAADIPEKYRDPQLRWTAYALRARVLAFHPQTTPPNDLPSSWDQLARPDFAKRTALANPLFGTTRGHVAALYALWGGDRARSWLKGLHEGGTLITDGNSSAVRAVIEGRAQYAVTDTDDVWAAQAAGAQLDCRYLDMGDGGTLWVPCSVAIVSGAPNRGGAQRLFDYLVSAEVERMLAQSASRNIPVREPLRTELRLELPFHSQISLQATADAMDQAVSDVREILLR